MDHRREMEGYPVSFTPDQITLLYLYYTLVWVLLIRQNHNNSYLALTPEADIADSVHVAMLPVVAGFDLLITYNTIKTLIF